MVSPNVVIDNPPPAVDETADINSSPPAVEEIVDVDNHPPAFNHPGTEHTVLDLLKMSLARFPIARNKRVACQTTDRPGKRFFYKDKEEKGDSEKLLGVMYCPNLLDRSLRLASLLVANIICNESNYLDVVFMTYISPKLTPSFYSPELFSEQDSREYCGVGLIRPALAAMHLVKTEGIPLECNCTNSDTDLYVTSGFKKKGSPVADCLLIKGPYTAVKGDTIEDEDQYEVVDEAAVSDEEDGGNDEEEVNGDEDDPLGGFDPDVLMTMEMKTSTALTDRTFSDVTRFKHQKRFRNTYIMPFIWPEVKGRKINKLSKMIAQVYEQLYHSIKAEYAWLSSYDVNIFFYMKKGTRVLYMSDQYDRTTMTPLHVFAWFCRADGLFEEDLDIPIPDEKFFHLNDPDINRAGLITVPMYNELVKKLPDPLTTPKRNRDETVEDLLDNEKTPRQRDYNRSKKKRRQNT